MSASLIPVLQRELQMLDGDPDNHKVSLKNLKAYAKDLDPQMIPGFVATISEAIDASDSCEDNVILVFEMLARLHGQKIIPNIGKIMSVILRTLSLGAESFESCSKVVSAMALYGIDPLAPDRENTKIIQSLCKPLSDALMSFEGNASSGAAVCLKGLVNLDVWRFASDEIVNEVCLKVTVALEKAPTQTNSHIGLVMALAKHNAWVLEAYVRSIIRSSFKILSSRFEDTSQKCLSVIRMINFLMKCVDARSFFSEIESITEFMEKYQYDQFPCVQDAAFEALQTAKIIAAPGGLRNKLDSDPITVTDLHGECEEKASWIAADYGFFNHGSSELPSHDSQPLIYDSFVCSAMSSGRSSCNIQGMRHADKTTRNTNIDSKDGTKKDGLFGQVNLYGNTSMVYFEHCRNRELNEESPGYKTSIQSSNLNSTNLLAESACTNTKRSFSIGDVRMTSTSRRLIPSRHSCSNSTVKNLDRPDFYTLRCQSSRDEAYMLPNQIDYSNLLHRRENSDNLKMSKEHQIQDELLREGLELPSYDSSALASNSMQACIRRGLEEGKNKQTLNLRKIIVSKAPLCQICSISMIFLVIILLFRLIANDEVLFDVLPT
ncbi:hypothetical protein IEQ34_015834 [Dendrobium chrysotoxum]|uniref:TORTIFOLIA1/SINE1-2 N-terminal domain-containing protein n=1 Tax=Dendrobium chrysotoxum TaxID=161865 RepID=A0AAV7GHV0_DENCH|nr:hypothetical protein IEQ34_015834 [Dendrobium chrysotoxum]